VPALAVVVGGGGPGGFGILPDGAMPISIWATSLVTLRKSRGGAGSSRSLNISLGRAEKRLYFDRYSIRPSRSRTSKSVSDSWISTVATFSSKWATLDVPGMGSITGLRRSSQASAIWLGVAS
jgi:hypothetical protein